MANQNITNGMIEIFCRSIKRNGKTIYPKNAKFFHFWIDPKKVNSKSKLKK